MANNTTYIFTSSKYPNDFFFWNNKSLVRVIQRTLPDNGIQVNFYTWKASQVVLERLGATQYQIALMDVYNNIPHIKMVTISANGVTPLRPADLKYRTRQMDGSESYYFANNMEFRVSNDTLMLTTTPVLEGEKQRTVISKKLNDQMDNVFRLASFYPQATDVIITKG